MAIKRIPLIVFVSLGIFFLGVFGIGGFLLWSSQGTRQSGEYFKQGFQTNQKTPYRADLQKGDELVVMSWNIAFAHGRGSEGESFTQKSSKEYLRRLDLMSKMIKTKAIDLFFIQEIDFSSQRTYFENQARILAFLGGFSDIAPVSSWRLRYLPFPGKLWERSRHFGQIDSGGAILSQLRLENHRFQLLPKPQGWSFLYQLFYLSRYIQEAEIQINQQAASIANLHLEAFEKENRLEHVKRLMETIQARIPLLIAGDFNHFDQTGYPSLVFGTDDYRGDQSYLYLQEKLPSYYKEALEEDANYLKTFPAEKPTRRLDYIYFDSRRLELLSTEVVVMQQMISDHLPVIARFRVR